MCQISLKWWEILTPWHLSLFNPFKRHLGLGVYLKREKEGWEGKIQNYKQSKSELQTTLCSKQFGFCNQSSPRCSQSPSAIMRKIRRWGYKRNVYPGDLFCFNKTSLKSFVKVTGELRTFNMAYKTSNSALFLKTEKAAGYFD